MVAAAMLRSIRLSKSNVVSSDLDVTLAIKSQRMDLHRRKLIEITRQRLHDGTVN